ncbi:MAG: type II toxin-antitoxin system RelB/DinJ family antitoxin [Burkholderiaceae bacterium]|nr:type II toxin-antitoxin system RelB/DinJ family antitoxin [Burkholderiaceae bacterium]
MASTVVSFRISEQIKNTGKPILEAHGTTVSEFCQNVLAYVAETGKIPVKKAIISQEDEELIRIARERLQETGSIAVRLEDL